MAELVSRMGQIIKVGQDEPLILGRKLIEAASAEQNAFISRTHASVSYLNGELLLEDKGSPNGTYINGLRVKSAGLKAGDVVIIGGAQSYEFGESYTAFPAWAWELVVVEVAPPVLPQLKVPIEQLSTHEGADATFPVNISSNNDEVVEVSVEVAAEQVPRAAKSDEAGKEEDKAAEEVEAPKFDQPEKEDIEAEENEAAKEVESVMEDEAAKDADVTKEDEAVKRRRLDDDEVSKVSTDGIEETEKVKETMEDKGARGDEDEEGTVLCRRCGEYVSEDDFESCIMCQENYCTPCLKEKRETPEPHNFYSYRDNSDPKKLEPKHAWMESIKIKSWVESGGPISRIKPILVAGAPPGTTVNGSMSKLEKKALSDYMWLNVPASVKAVFQQKYDEAVAKRKTMEAENKVRKEAALWRRSCKSFSSFFCASCEPAKECDFCKDRCPDEGIFCEDCCEQDMDHCDRCEGDFCTENDCKHHHIDRKMCPGPFGQFSDY